MVQVPVMLVLLPECWHPCSSGSISNVEEDDIQAGVRGESQRKLQPSLHKVSVFVSVYYLLFLLCLCIFVHVSHFSHLSSDACRRMESVKLLDVTVHTLTGLKFK